MACCRRQLAPQQYGDGGVLVAGRSSDVQGLLQQQQ